MSLGGRVQRLTAQQFGDGQHAVHRRAQLVAHDGQELALGARGGDGLGASVVQSDGLVGQQGVLFALQIMDVTKADQLGEICAAVGLAQNMGALRALATEGIQRGHMALHARNIAIHAGATGKEVDEIAATMAREKDVRADRAEALLKALRG